MECRIEGKQNMPGSNPRSYTRAEAIEIESRRDYFVRKYFVYLENVYLGNLECSMFTHFVIKYDVVL